MEKVILIYLVPAGLLLFKVLQSYSYDSIAAWAKNLPVFITVVLVAPRFSLSFKNPFFKYFCIF